MPIWEPRSSLGEGVPVARHHAVRVDNGDGLSAPQALADELAEQRAGWGLFYDVLDALETAIAQGDQKALALRDATQRVVQSCRIQSGDGSN